MLQQYKSINMRHDSLAMLALCKQIVKQYRAQGLRLTLRQLYYQLVTKNAIKNEEKSYRNLSNLVSNGRLVGDVDWDAIEDRGRLPKVPPEFDSLKELVETALNSYRLPRLEGQEHYLELWVEKDALAGVLSPLARKYHLVLQVNKGYASQSSMYEAACRIDKACRAPWGDDDHEEGGVCKDAIILYLGDLDPSGEDMVRDIQDRLDLFLKGYLEGGGTITEDGVERDRLSPALGWIITDPYYDAVQLSVIKIGITFDQVQRYKPPPNPAKLSDSRAAAYIAKYGKNSWEVDALPPNVLQQIITTEVEARLDLDMMQRIVDREQLDKSKLREAAEQIMKGEA